jgi:hypothetical protein
MLFVADTNTLTLGAAIRTLRSRRVSKIEKAAATSQRFWFLRGKTISDNLRLVRDGGK